MLEAVRWLVGVIMSRWYGLCPAKNKVKQGRAHALGRIDWVDFDFPLVAAVLPLRDRTSNRAVSASVPLRGCARVSDCVYFAVAVGKCICKKVWGSTLVVWISPPKN